MNWKIISAAVCLSLALLQCGPAMTLAQPTVKTSKAPETSADESFQPQSLTKLAVIVVPDERQRQVQSEQQRMVDDIFVQTLLQRGHVVAARSDLKSVLKEQALSSSGLTDGNAAAAGKLWNVAAVLVVRITESATESQRDPKRNIPILRARATVGVRLVSAETGSVWWQGNHTLSEVVGSKSELLRVLANTTEKLAKAFPERKPEKPVSFDPKDFSKLAVIMVGESRSRQSQQDQQRLVEDKFGVVLGNKGYSLVSRSDLQSVMQEQRFQQSGLTEENVSDFGKLLSVPAVMVVRITAIEVESHRNPGSKASTQTATAGLGARLVNVETGEVFWCRTLFESQEVGGKLDASEVLTKVTKKLVDAFPSRATAKNAAVTSE